MPPKEFLKDRLKNDINIKEKSPEEQKRIIKTYVQKVLVFPDYIEIYTDRGLSDGAEGNRTPCVILEKIIKTRALLIYTSNSRVFIFLILYLILLI